MLLDVYLVFRKASGVMIYLLILLYATLDVLARWLVIARVKYINDLF